MHTSSNNPLQEYQTFNPLANINRPNIRSADIKTLNIQNMALKIIKNIDHVKKANKENRTPIKRLSTKEDDYVKIEASVNTSLEVSELKKQKVSMEQEVNRLQTEIKIKNKKLDELTITNKTLTFECATSSNLVREKDKDLQNSNAQLSKLKVKYFEYQDSLSKKESEYTTNLAKLEEENHTK